MPGTLAKAISISIGEHGAYTPFEDEEEDEEEGPDHFDLTRDAAPLTPAERAFANEMSEFDGDGNEPVEASEEEAAGVGTPRVPHGRYARPAPGVGVDPRPRRLVKVPARLAAATPPAAAGDKRGAGGSSGDRPRRKVAVSSA